MKRQIINPKNTTKQNKRAHGEKKKIAAWYMCGIKSYCQGPLARHLIQSLQGSWLLSAQKKKTGL